MREMISRRLTKTQKNEILEAYKAGDNTNLIAENYNCTTNTINRTVKTLLSESEYTFLKKNRLKISNNNQKLINNKIVKEQNADLKKENSLISLEEKIQDEDLKVNEESYGSDFDRINSLAFVDSDDLIGDLNPEDLTDENHDIYEKAHEYVQSFHFHRQSL